MVFPWLVCLRRIKCFLTNTYYICGYRYSCTYICTMYKKIMYVHIFQIKKRGNPLSKCIYWLWNLR